MRILTPGLYALVAIQDDEDEDTGAEFRAFPATPEGYNRFDGNHFGDLGYVTVGDEEIGVGIVDSPVGPEGTLLIGIDLGDLPDSFTCTSVNSPLGALSISDAYALFPTTSRETSDTPGGQDQTNWLVLDLKDETTISVDGGRILIGADVVDVAAGPDLSIMTHSLDGVEVQWGDEPSGRRKDVVTTKHVVRAGTELHALLLTMVDGEDDGVMVSVNTDAAGLAAVQTIDTPEARVVAKDLQRYDDSIGTILHFHVKGNILPQEAIDKAPERQQANLVNA